MANIDDKINAIIALPEAERVAAMKKCAKQVFLKGVAIGMLAASGITIITYGIIHFIKKKKA